MEMVLYKVREKDQDPDLKYLHGEASKFWGFLGFLKKERKKNLHWEGSMQGEKRKQQQEGIQRQVDVLRLTWNYAFIAMSTFDVCWRWYTVIDNDCILSGIGFTVLCSTMLFRIK